jgi:hypothetical protein
MDGIISVAFGGEYDRFAAKAARLTRDNTDVPIVVISNLETRSEIWDGIAGVEFIYIDDQQDNNRFYKIRCADYSPFDRTLFIDADAFVQNPGIEKVFDMIPDDGLLVNHYDTYCRNTSASQLYNQALYNSKLRFPIDVYYGAFFGFKKNTCNDFFNTWLSFWRQNGSGSDMPAMCCAVKSSGVNKHVLNCSDNVFAWKENRRALIQHEYCGFLKAAIDYDDFKPHKPFDIAPITSNCPRVIIRDEAGTAPIPSNAIVRKVERIH